MATDPVSHVTTATITAGDGSQWGYQLVGSAYVPENGSRNSLVVIDANNIKETQPDGFQKVFQTYDGFTTLYRLVSLANATGRDLELKLQRQQPFGEHRRPLQPRHNLHLRLGQ